MQVIKTAGNALWASPLSFLEASTPGTGGWVDTPNQRLGVRHVLPISTPEELAQVTVEGAPSKRLGDVATVVEDHQPLIGEAIVKDDPALMLVVDKFPWANTSEVTEEAEEALAALRPGLSGLEMDSSLFRPATYLDSAVRNVSRALLIGAVLVIAALFVFLFNWRTALIGSASILLSAMTAAMVLYLRGIEINMMILAGLMLALSVVIDDALVDVENIARRLRDARNASNGRSTANIIAGAVLEMRSPLFYATLILFTAVIPVFFLIGVTGAFSRPLAASYVLASLASMVVALTVTPALSLMFLQGVSLREGAHPIIGRFPRFHDGVFSWVSRTPRVAFIAVLVMACGFLALPVVRQESLLPDFKETDLVIRWEGHAAASHPAMSRITRRVCRELRSIPGVKNVSAHVGRAIMSDKRTNVDAAEIWVSIDPTADYDGTVRAVEDVVAGYPGLSREVLTYLQAKFREELSGTSDSLVVRVYGEDMNVIRKKAAEVEQVLATIDGIADPKAHYPREMPTLEIEVDLEKAKPYGLKPGDVRRAATSLVAGVEVGNLFEEQKVFDVVVLGTPDTRHSLTSIQNLLIDTPSGGHVRLQDVADLRIVPAPTVIHRDSVARRIDVTANLRGRGVAAVAADVQRALRQIDFPLEYRAELLGEYAERLAAQDLVRAFVIGAAIGIFLLLQAVFRSWRLALVVFLTLPMALSGGVLAACANGGGILSLGSLIGFLAVFGIAVRNNITLVSRYRHLEQEGEEFGAELIQRGARERAAPILASASATALAFLPLALSGNIAGLEIVHPMAIVVLGGLITTTLFSLVVAPATYLLFGADFEPELELQPTTVSDEIVTEAAPARS
jgi:Cu/Ag efflux pump CusA